MKVLEKQDLENLLYEIKGFETISYYYKNLDIDSIIKILTMEKEIEYGKEEGEKITSKRIDCEDGTALYYIKVYAVMYKEGMFKKWESVSETYLYIKRI